MPSLKAELGISGHPNAHLSGNANLSANDGTITRFGWKAQNKSLLMFAGEAYNVEMGISNQLFPQERDETPTCLFTATPNDTLNFTTTPTSHRHLQSGRHLRHRGVCQLHADAGPAHPGARHAVHRKWTGRFHQGRLCPLPYAFVYHGQDDCQRLRERSRALHSPTRR